VAVQQSKVQALSGTVATVANLGLPQLPDRFASAGGGLQALLTGTHQLRIAVDGRDRQRLALLGDLAETDVVHNGNDVWTYTSMTNTSTHRTIGRAAVGANDGAESDPAQLTPAAQADKALKAIDPSTAVTVDRTARVAGRPAYQLVLTPRTTATLIRSVRIAIDAATGVPLRVQVFSRGVSAPAFQTGFTHVSFSRPAASTFDFTPPAGSLTSAAGAGTPDRAGTAHGGATHKDGAGSAQSSPTTVGKDWGAILVLPAGTVPAAATVAGGTGGAGAASDGQGSSFAAMLDRVSTRVPGNSGDRLVTTRLLSAVVTPDGRVFLGAVPPAAVEAAAGA
jgi:outer membrane lipoprotein-sorting protein